MQQTKTERLTRKQIDALETIRDQRTKFFDEKVDRQMSGVFTDMGGSTRHPYRAEFDMRTVRALEKRGLVELEVIYDDPGRAVHMIRITDAGRVALGDWAAGERAGLRQVA